MYGLLYHMIMILNNRKKKDKTLYQDEKYLKAIGTRLHEIEEKFTFTSEEDLEWANHSYTNAKDIEKNYYEFLQKHFEIQKKKIIDSLFK